MPRHSKPQSGRILGYGIRTKAHVQKHPWIYSLLGAAAVSVAGWIGCKLCDVAWGHWQNLEASYLSISTNATAIAQERQDRIAAEDRERDAREADIAACRVAESNLLESSHRQWTNDRALDGRLDRIEFVTNFVVIPKPPQTKW